ncbi:MAG TPA: hypothetical protein VM925_27475 [Labilithrix sp.]|nr:hypothetical protein [Labilithrix sp.]
MDLSLRALSLVVAVGISACVAPREGVHTAGPAEVVAASAMTADELARSKGQETVYGWKLEIVGERARFFSCTTEHVCGERAVDVPVKSVIATKVVGRVRPSRADGSELEETDVHRLTIASDVQTSRGGVVSDPHRGLTVGAPSKQ